jgi:hypothetical protein
LAQVERVEALVERKRQMGAAYNECLKDIEGLQLPVEEPWAKNVYWMYGLVLDESTGMDADAFAEALTVAGKYGLPWDEADALHERARMHLARDGKDDRKQALALLDETIAIYQRLGAKKHLELVLAEKLEVQGISTIDVLTSIDRVAISVHEEKPDLSPHAAPDGTVTIMFSDIEGSTAMNERLGDRRWLELLREHNVVIREKVNAYGGFEVKSAGDGFMLAFQSARRALECAIAIQKALPPSGA